MKCRTPVVLTAALVLSACSSTMECDKRNPYLEAVPGKRVELLDGMDPLPPGDELSIPQASPDAPAPLGECVDAPPTLNTESIEK